MTDSADATNNVFGWDDVACSTALPIICVWSCERARALACLGVARGGMGGLWRHAAGFCWPGCTMQRAHPVGASCTQAVYHPGQPRQPATPRASENCASAAGDYCPPPSPPPPSPPPPPPPSPPPPSPPPTPPPTPPPAPPTQAFVYKSAITNMTYTLYTDWANQSVADRSCRGAGGVLVTYFTVREQVRVPPIGAGRQGGGSRSCKGGGAGAALCRRCSGPAIAVRCDASCIWQELAHMMPRSPPPLPSPPLPSPPAERS
jgi:hypothetical protein